MGKTNSQNGVLKSVFIHRRFIHAWTHSLRFRLLWLGLMPLLLAFPTVLISLGVSGNAQLNQLIEAQLSSNLSGAQNYLRVVQTDLQSRITDFVQSERITKLIQEKTPRAEIDRTLSATLRGSGFDFLLIIDRDGSILGSNSQIPIGARVPHSYVIQQAQLGVASSGFEQFRLDQLVAFSPEKTKKLADALRKESNPKVTMINAAAHFPLSVTEQDAILMGGVFINENSVLIEHLREIIYPAGKLPDQAEGFVGVFVNNQSVISSRLKSLHSGSVSLAKELIPESGTTTSSILYGSEKIGDTQYGLAVSPIMNGDEQPIAALAVGFPLAPYTHTAWLLLAIVSGMLGLIMLTISAVYLNAGRAIVTQIKTMIDTMTGFGNGNRLARIKSIERRDELGSLARNVNDLLETITHQEKEQIAAQQLISDEASRRRAIFSSVKDGVIVLDENGQIIEANPQTLFMLGYSEQELKRLKLSDWDTNLSSNQFLEKITQLAQNGSVYESNHRRKDGTYYPAETSVSQAAWAGKKFILLLMRDISLRKSQENELKISASVFTAALEAIVLSDPNGVITDVNEAYTRIMGYEKSDVIGKNAGVLGLTEDNSHMSDFILNEIQNVGYWAGEVELKHQSCKIIPVQLKVSAVRSDDGAIQHLVAMFSDISLQKQQQLRLEQLALHDPLTQLPNRQKLSESLTHAMAASQRSGQYGALMMIDLDNFKPLNDQHGHAAGDQFLIDIAHRLTACVRELDTVARLGGDEFVILLESLSQDKEIAAKNAHSIAEKIRNAIAQPTAIKSSESWIAPSNLSHTCSASIGVTLFLGKELGQTQLLNQADSAMYLSKASGKNDIHFYGE